jgi:hypothetical protein
MTKLVTILLSVAGIGLAGAQVAAADPDGRWLRQHLRTGHSRRTAGDLANGQSNCVTLDQAYESGPPLTSQDVISVIEGYRAHGWDLESASDTVWESVEWSLPGIPGRGQTGSAFVRGPVVRKVP